MFLYDARTRLGKAERLAARHGLFVLRDGTPCRPDADGAEPDIALGEEIRRGLLPEARAREIAAERRA